MSNLKPYLRKSLYVIALLLLVGLMVVLRINQRKQICEKVEIEIDAPIEKQLVTPALINEQINKWYSSGLLGATHANLDLADLEIKLEKMPAVQSAEVSFSLRGILLVQINQRVPVVRIINSSNGASYYIAKDFTQIPANGVEVARVPISNGRLTNAMIKKVYTLSTAVQENAFIEALTEQIFVNDNNDLVIIPKIKNQSIIIGDTLELSAKFSKLQSFYVQALNHEGWDKYQNINLKYKNQIVCN
jgi:cell division protein FtsQ